LTTTAATIKPREQLLFAHDGTITGSKVDVEYEEMANDMGELFDTMIPGMLRSRDTKD